MTDIRPEDEVRWTPTGEVGRVIGLTTEPSAIVVFPDTARRTIGLSKLEKVEPPLPPLPTEPYTVIEVTPRVHGWSVWRKTTDSGDWWRPWEGGITASSAALLESITSFKVLSEPVEPVAIRLGPDGKYRSVATDAAFRAGIKAAYDHLVALPDYYGADRVSLKFGVEK